MKKGMSQMWFIISAAIIAILVVIFLLIFFRGGVDKGSNVVHQQLDSLGDCDADKVANLFDKCPCDASVGDSWPDGHDKECKPVCTDDGSNCKNG